MLKIEKIFILFFMVSTLTACSEYQKVLNKGKADARYKMATELFEQKKYSKSIALFEKVIPAYERKPQMQRIMYMVAESYYYSKDYDLSAYYFNRFISNYPNSSKIEEATYLVAHSYYLASPKYMRDQKDTEKALISFQEYIDKYPSSERLVDANKFYDELTFRLEKKSFEIAKQYYHVEDYNAAVAAFENFLQEHIGSSLKEDALYFKFKASNDLAVNSILEKKEERITDAITVHDKFMKSFPESERIKEVASLYKNLNNELKQTKELIEKYTNSINNGL